MASSSYSLPHLSVVPRGPDGGAIFRMIEHNCENSK